MTLVLQTRRRHIFRLYAVPVAILLAVTLPKLGQGQFNVDTGWYSAIALQSWRAAVGGEGPAALWTLRGYGGDPYFNKPPLGFWIHGLFLWLLGPTVLAARLPAVLAAAGCVVFTVRAVRAGGASGGGRGSAHLAVLTGIILALSIEFSRHARAFSLDMWQAMFLCAAVWVAVHAVGRGRGWMLALCGLPIGLALLTKPLVALLALPILGLWLVWIGRWRWVGWVGLAGVLAAVVAGPWHISMVMLHGDVFVHQYFGREVMERAAGTLGDANESAASIWYYPRELVRGYWPWLVTVVLGYVAWGRAVVARWGLSAQSPTTSPPPSHGRWHGDGVQLAVLWSLAWLVLLSIFPDKRPRYLLPVFPAWAWLSAVWIVNDGGRWVQLMRRAVERWAMPIAVAAAVLISLAPIRIERDRTQHYAEVFAKLADLGADQVWEGGYPNPARGARFYLEMGQWPRRMRDGRGEIAAVPPPGALIVYHQMDGFDPGGGAEIVLRTGPLTLVRMGGQVGHAP